MVTLARSKTNYHEWYKLKLKKFLYRNSTEKSQEQGKTKWYEKNHAPLIP